MWLSPQAEILFVKGKNSRRFMFYTICSSLFSIETFLDMTKNTNFDRASHIGEKSIINGKNDNAL